MRIRPDFRGAFLCFYLSLLLVSATFCYGVEESTIEVVGIGECADCTESNIKTSQALSGLRITIDCKPENGHFKTRGVGELDEEGKFKVNLPSHLVKVGNKLKEECYAQLHGASAAPCPTHSGLESSKIVFKSKNNGKRTFGLAGKLKFSPVTCTSAFLWPHFKHPLLPYLPPLPKWKLPPLKNFGHHPYLFPPKVFPPLPPKVCPPFPPKVLPPLVPAYNPPLEVSLHRYQYTCHHQKCPLHRYQYTSHHQKCPLRQYQSTSHHQKSPLHQYQSRNHVLLLSRNISHLNHLFTSLLQFQSTSQNQSHQCTSHLLFLSISQNQSHLCTSHLLFLSISQNQNHRPFTIPFLHSLRNHVLLFLSFLHCPRFLQSTSTTLNLERNGLQCHGILLFIRVLHLLLVPCCMLTKFQV